MSNHQTKMNGSNNFIIFTPKKQAMVRQILDQNYGVANALESVLSVKLKGNQDCIEVSGDDQHIAKDILTRIADRVEINDIPSAGEIMSLLQGYQPTQVQSPAKRNTPNNKISTQKKTVLSKSKGQEEYIANLMLHEMNFGLGPAGSGKTFLAVGAAVQALENGEVDKIILTRPAVEAGEKLGYLPGDMKDKVDPYMQPIYDALSDFMQPKTVEKLIESKIIEIAPIAFMRGRTLKNAFVILDEAQNATSMQMKMFLTRMGEGSKMVVVGDPTQSDLPKGTKSGLVDAVETLKSVQNIGFSKMTASDVFRHPLVAAIIKAYENA